METVTPERGLDRPVASRSAIAWWLRWREMFACLATVVLALPTLIWLAAASQHTRLGQQVDVAGSRAVVGDLATTRDLLDVLGDVSIGSAAAATVVVVALAVARRHLYAAIAAVILVVGTNLTTQAIKHTLHRSDFGMLTVPSLPSGHTTVACSLVLAALLVAPPAWRSVLVPLGSLAVTLVGAATLVAGWHRPADVLAALLVCLIWVCLVLAVWIAATRGFQHDHVVRPAAAAGVPAWVGAVLATAILVAIGVRPHHGWTGVLDAAMVLTLVGSATAWTVRTTAGLSASVVIAPPGPGPHGTLGSDDRRV